MSGSSPRFYELIGMRKADLEKVFLRGSMPKLEKLAGWEFRGMNHPRWARLAGIKKFMKGFYWETKDNLHGYNCPVIQNSNESDWIFKDSAEDPGRFGYYRVAPVDEQAKDNAYLNSVLLNYGEGGNPVYDPSRNLRDYLVQVDPDNEDLYLGKAYYALGPARVPTNFFLLERQHEARGQVRRK
jgi:hypothetical protein